MESRTDQESERRWILVVDGDAQTQRILDLSLRNAGFEVGTAASATEALAWLAENRADLIIAAVELAGSVDGFELCRRVKEQPDHATTPFIFLAEASVESKLRGVKVGGDDFLSKPIYVQEVLARARALLQRRERDRLVALAQENERFAGELDDIPLIDLLRAVEPARKSGVAHLYGPAGTRGEIYFRQGAVVDAEVGRLSGREAVFRLFSWGSGRFEIEWKSIRRKDTVEMEPASLLMEALRRVEEWRRLVGDVPPLDTVFEVDYRLLAERLAEIPDEVNGILRLFDGVRTFIQVIDDSGLGDLEAVAVIGKLHRERIISDIKVKPESEDIPGADIEGWLTEASGPFRSAAEPARRDLFGSGPHAGGVHERTTQPVAPLEEGGGREALADDMRARFTDRLHAEGLVAETAPEGPVAEASTDNTVPLRASMPASETTLQGVGVGSLLPRPNTSPGFAATASGGARSMPEVTPHTRAPSPAAAGSGEGIPEAVVPVEGEPAIVIPFPTPAGAAHDAEPLGEEPRAAVAGEIVSRKTSPRSRDSRASEERLAQLRENENLPNRSTEPGLGPAGPEPPRALEAIEEAEGAEVLPWPSAHPPAERRHDEANPATELTPAEGADELGASHRARGLLLVAAAALVTFVGGTGLFMYQRAKEGARVRAIAARKPATQHAPAPLAPPPEPAAEKRVPPPETAEVAGGPGLVPAKATRSAGAGAARSKPGVERAAPGRSPGQGPPTDELDERASDPKLARSQLAEFPQLLAACRTAFVDTRMKDAEVACVAARDANPESAEAHALLARALFNRHRRREALTWAERALKLDPNLADAYVIVGGVHQSAGEAEEAKAAYRKYLSLAPTGQYAADLRAIVDGLK